MSLAFPNTVLNTIAAEAIDELAGKLEERISGGTGMPEAVLEVVKEAYLANKTICFSGDNSPRSGTPRPSGGPEEPRDDPGRASEVLSEDTVAAFEKYEVLSKRELESRFEVWIEQYAIRANIEAETTHSIAQTMILPAALRYVALIAESGVAEGLGAELKGLLEDLARRCSRSRKRIRTRGIEGVELAVHARDKQLEAMVGVRDAADKLEKVVADDMWPLPKYAEISSSGNRGTRKNPGQGFRLTFST